MVRTVSSQESLMPDGVSGDFLILPINGFARNRSSFPYWAAQYDDDIVAGWNTTVRVIEAMTDPNTIQHSLRLRGISKAIYVEHVERLHFIYKAGTTAELVGRLIEDGYAARSDRYTSDNQSTPITRRRIGFRALSDGVLRLPYAQRALIQAQTIMVDGAHGRIPYVRSLTTPATPTFRQLMTLALTGKGLVDSMIAQALVTTHDSVDTTSTAALKNLGVATRAEAIDMLFATGIFFPVLPITK